MFKLVKIESLVKVLPMPADSNQPEDLETGSSTAKETVPAEKLKQQIYAIRGQSVMLDEDIAVLYGFEVKSLNEKVKRNKMRFPDNYVFQLKDAEYDSLRSQIAALNRGERRKNLPYVFTERGVVMLSGILDSYKALEMSFTVVEDFIRMRKLADIGKETVSKVVDHDKKPAGQGNSINAVVDYIIGTAKKNKNEKKYGFGKDEKNNIVQEGQRVATYGQQH